jgi:hypothetical protein
MTMKIISILMIAAFIGGCGKVGVSGSIDRAFGSWAAVRLPDGCVAKMIAADEHGGVSVLCEDGRVFH